MDLDRNRPKSSHLSSESGHQILLPSTIFCDRRFTALEATAIYLKEEHKLGFSEIGRLLARSRKTIWTVYQRSVAKRLELASDIISAPNVFIPISVLTNRKLSPLEACGTHLSQTLSNSQISKVVCRSQKTIWTVKERAKKKWQKK